MRAVQFLDALAGHHQVTLLTPRPEAGVAEPALPPEVEVAYYRPGSRVTGALGAAARGAPLQSGLFGGRHLERQLRSVRDVDLVVLQLARLAPLVERSRAPVYVDLIDALSLNFAGRARHDRTWLRPLLRSEARRACAGRAGDPVARRRRLRGLRARPLSSARGRSAGRRRPAPARDPPANARALGASFRSKSGRGSVALTGNLGYFVNLDAATWFLGEVWPEARAALGDARLVVAGARAPAALRRLARSVGAELLDSPDDLLGTIGGAASSIAPTRCGSGVPVKVLEAWSMQTPVVASPFAAAGVSASDGVELLCAESPEEWVASLRRCLDDDALRRRLVGGGVDRLRSHHDAEAIARELRSRLEEAAGRC